MLLKGCQVGLMGVKSQQNLRSELRSREGKKRRDRASIPYSEKGEADATLMQ
jgi:hypothetical protein